MNMRQIVNDNLLPAMNELVSEYYSAHYKSLEPRLLACDFSARATYWRIYSDSSTGRDKRVEFFVHKVTGDVLFGGWVGPSAPKVARFNISTPQGLERLLAHKRESIHGYLYLDTIKETDKKLSLS